MIASFRVLFPVLIVLVAASPGVALAEDPTAATVPAVSRAAILGPDAAACASGSHGSAVLVTVSGFKDRAGNVRVQLYSDNDKDFLRSGMKLTAEGKIFRRVEAATPADGDAAICVQLPGPGRYTLAVLHDRNADGQLNVFSDGFGFPNNPKVSFSPPKADKAAFNAGDGITALSIRLKYF